MNKTGYAPIGVKITWSAGGDMQQAGKFQALDIPPRSRLYGLVPCGMETVWSESLTSYINRLGWRHGVSPRALVAQEMAPHLRHEHPLPHLPSFCHQGAIRLNGNGGTALEWSALLEQLTMRSDLHLLTLQWWVGDLQSRELLRKEPAWCPACYAEWKKQGLPIYQPLLWMVLVVTVCPRHKRFMVQRCPHCQAKQAVITSHTMETSECRKCGVWLGMEADLSPELIPDNETANWQQWVFHVLGELQSVSRSSGPISWETFFTNLARAMRQRGSYSRLARLSGVKRETLHRWTAGMIIPSFEMILKFCYVCDTTPLQLMVGQFASLERAIQEEVALHPRRYWGIAPGLTDRERCRECIQAILDGREQPLGPYMIAKRLGCSLSSLWRFFPQECALLTQQAQAYQKQQREQRMVQIREWVRQEVRALHAQGIAPTHRQLRQRCPPGHMSRPEVDRAWHDALRELGLRP